MPNGPGHQTPAIGPRHLGLRASSFGFTLMEVMFAIGIMGIGMVMVASLFPAAIRESNTSYSKTLGTLVAKNGLAVAKAAVSGGSRPGTIMAILADENTTTILSKKSQHYQELDDDDLATGDLIEGFVILGKQMQSSENDYLLFSIAYARPVGRTVSAEQVSVGSATDSNTLTVNSGSSDLRNRSPIIFATDNSYATIIQVSGNTITLDREVTVSAQQAFVIVESGTATGDDSPALAVISTRTALGE